MVAPQDIRLDSTTLYRAFTRQIRKFLSCDCSNPSIGVPASVMNHANVCAYVRMCVCLIRLAYGKLALGEIQPYRVFLLLVWELPEVRYVEPPTERHTYIHTLSLGSAAVRRCPHFPVGAFPLLKKITGEGGGSHERRLVPARWRAPHVHTWFNFPHMHTHLIDRLALSCPLTHHLS